MKLLNTPHCGHRDDRILSCDPALFFPSCFSGGIRFGATRGTARCLLRFLNPYVFVQVLRRTGTLYSSASSTLRIVTTRNTSARHAINIPWSFLPAKVYAFVTRLTISNRHCRSSPPSTATKAIVLFKKQYLPRILQRHRAPIRCSTDHCVTSLTSPLRSHDAQLIGWCFRHPPHQTFVRPHVLHVYLGIKPALLTKFTTISIVEASIITASAIPYNHGHPQ